MTRLKTKYSLLFFILLQIIVSSCGGNDKTPGLIGIYYSEPNLTSIKALVVLEDLEQTWDESVDFQGETSGEWNGYIIAPKSGMIEFSFSTDFTAEVSISDKKIRSDNENPSVRFSLDMIEGASYPINLLFWHTGKKHESGSFSLRWSLNGDEFTSIPIQNIYHTEKESSVLDFLNEIDPENIDRSQFIFPEVEHKVVYYEEGRFAAWPANSGIWIWGNEILVGFLQAYYKENKYHHAIVYSKPSNETFARSIDGGKTWTIEKASQNFAFGVISKEFKGRMNFAGDGFALKNRGESFFYSDNRGKSWNGPFSLPDLDIGEFSSRTDYIIDNENEAFIFTSVKDIKVRAALQDRAVTLRTKDGGRKFEHIGFMTELDSIRSVMPATVRIDDNHLISAMRRRVDPPRSNKLGLVKNWIDVYESYDNGKTWKFLNKIANTDRGIRNGNPPSMVRLNSGRLVVAYGYRAVPYSIRARMSDDKGKTWSKEIILRDDAITWDIGYCRTVALPNDEVVTIYYYSTDELKERHISATIWNPNTIKF